MVERRGGWSDFNLIIHFHIHQRSDHIPNLDLMCLLPISIMQFAAFFEFGIWMENAIWANGYDSDSNGHPLCA
jgi:hypothetical protein